MSDSGTASSLTGSVKELRSIIGWLDFYTHLMVLLTERLSGSRVTPSDYQREMNSHIQAQEILLSELTELTKDSKTGDAYATAVSITQSRKAK